MLITHAQNQHMDEEIRVLIEIIKTLDLKVSDYYSLGVKDNNCIGTSTLRCV